MKRFTVLFPVLFLMFAPLVRTEPTVQEIVRKMAEVERVASSKSTGKQIITTSGGQKRTLDFESFSRDDNEKQLIVYTGPERVAGDKILLRDDGNEVWFYTPKTDTP